VEAHGLAARLRQQSPKIRGATPFRDVREMQSIWPPKIWLEPGALIDDRYGFNSRELLRILGVVRDMTKQAEHVA
jgi:hypothetical protein